MVVLTKMLILIARNPYNKSKDNNVANDEMEVGMKRKKGPKIPTSRSIRLTSTIFT
jgi:hypothetical protein